MAHAVAVYKKSVAEAARSINPASIESELPAGSLTVSPKIDGEQWFLWKSAGNVLLVSPAGRLIADIALTAEAQELLGDWCGLLAGELYATAGPATPTVYDLHAALGGEAGANTKALRFAAFDIVWDGGQTRTPGVPFSSRAARLAQLLAGGHLIHSVPFEASTDPAIVRHRFDEIVATGGEGLAARDDSGRLFKIKPWITIDAAVVAYASHENRVTELLLGLIPDAQDGTPPSQLRVRLIGRVDTGFSREERAELAAILGPLSCEGGLATTSRGGLAYQWVRPEIVVQVRCHGIIRGTSSGPVRRWELAHAPGTGWTVLGRRPSVSLRDAVFERVREDKRAVLPDVRWSQADIGCEEAAPAPLPASDLLRRDVFIKPARGGGCAVRKLLVWKTNKEQIDPRHPAYAAHFTCWSPARQQALRTDVKGAATQPAIMEIAESWLAKNIGRGWKLHARTGAEAGTGHDRAVRPNDRFSHADAHTLTIAFARSTSPTFPIVRRRLDALAELGELNVSTDERGRESWFELTIERSLVPSFRRLANLLGLVRRWRTTEISLDGELLHAEETVDVVNRIEEIHSCWKRHQARGPAGCRAECAVGCAQLRVRPSERFLEGAFVREPPWFTVGTFDGSALKIDKQILSEQLAWRRNRLLACCPLWNQAAIMRAIGELPDAIRAGQPGWRVLCRRDSGAAAWLWPEEIPTPPGLTSERPGAGARDASSTALRSAQSGNATPRLVASATYSDVCGQEAAVAAVREMIELPLRHASLFAAIGAEALPGGIILAGPPGTGKTLLARAVAGECGAHIEIVSGPEILSPWVGGSEQALRDVFERARARAPSVVLFDELDSIAPARNGAQHERALVGQLLALLDGLEGRAGISVLATTNQPERIDPALRRPGRFDRIVWMRLPNRRGRRAILRRHLSKLRLAPGLDLADAADRLATRTRGMSGATLAFLCQSAARECVREAVAASQAEHHGDAQPADLSITAAHLAGALASVLRDG